MKKLMCNCKWVLMICWGLLLKTAFATPPYTDTKEVRVSKKLTFDFKAQPDLTARLQFKYTHIILTSWAKDSVKVEAEITANGSNLTEANKILERVTLQYDHTPQNLNMRLDIAQEQALAKKGENNSFSNIMSGLVQSFSGSNHISSSSSINIDQNNLKVVLKIRLPQTSFPTIDNRYGNTELIGNFTNKVTAGLFYGDFKAERLHAAQLDLSYGEVFIRQLVKGTVMLRQGSLKLERVGELSLISNSTTVEIDSVANLLLDARNDDITLKKTGKLNGKAHFTQLAVQQLSIETNLETQFGSLQFVRLLPSLSTLDIMARSTDVRLEQLLPDTRYDLVVRPEKWQAPERLLRQERQPFEAAKGHVRIVWTEGNPKRSIAIENREGSVLMK
ncbi:MAG: hypothetical protein RMJ87_03890 [Cytophagales bacterium]|nr:hypothetical protein [Bernardetiaceae bacterium]MDW8204149.1 hypothetical protein [Cytophagales bacterium]